MIRPYPYRLYPTNAQERAAVFVLAQARHVYNAALEQRIRVYRETEQGVTYRQQWAHFRDERRANRETLGQLTASSLQHALRQAGIPAAVATSASRRKVEIVERQLGLQGLFAAHVTIDDLTRGKPDPECYRTAAARLGKAPERCLVFEDAVIGVRAGVAAGARCIGIQPEADVAADLIRAGAWRVVPDFTALRVEVEGGGIWLNVNGGEAVGLAGTPGLSAAG